MKNDKEIELIIGNSNSNFSGVTSTMLQVLSHQKGLINLRVMGKHHLLDPSLAISFWQTVLLCRKPMKNGGWRIFHARRVDEMIQALLLKIFFRAKIKIIFSSAAQRYRSSFTLWLIRRMDAVLAMCEASNGYLERPANAIIYHGVQTEVYHPAMDKSEAWNALNLLSKNGEKSKYGIAILGRVRKQKGVHLFVESCISVLEKHPDYTAVIVGPITASNENFVSQLKGKVIQAGLTDRIVFVGEQDFSDIPSIFSALSVVVALSDNEGFGLTVLEAMSSGAAVLASDAGAWKEVIREGIDGYVVPVDDLSAVINRLDSLLSDKNKIIKMGAAGRERVLQNYSIEREAEELCEFYKTLF
jgi:mannosyltransferase